MTAKPRVPIDGASDPACVARFWAKVGNADANGCRRWTGAHVVSQWGARTGVFRGGPWRPDPRGGRARAQVKAARFAWVVTYGPIPEGLEICHSCDVHDCCEVAHMRLGTRADNMHDVSARFVTAAGGEGHGMAKLTHAEAREVYDLAHASCLTLRQIAAAYGVDKTTVSNIKQGRIRRYSVHEAPRA